MSQPYTAKVSLPPIYASDDTTIALAEAQAHALVATQRANRWHYKYEKLSEGVRKYKDGRIGLSALLEMLDE